MSEAELSDWETFFSSNPAPSQIDSIESLIKEFVKKHASIRPICLVTSGGTTVPLEVNTVRFVDNFSAGTRGSASAEYFLDAGYAVVFLHREKSLCPFTRHVDSYQLLQSMSVKTNGDLLISGADAVSLKSVIEKSQKYKETLLSVPFTSLSSYLWLLRLSSQILSDLCASDNAKCLLYLAAAVSDFHVPTQELPLHKIQSSKGAPSVQLSLVPKMLRPLVSVWAVGCFVVSFKLETDPEILLQKSKTALEKYNHDLVIGNILDTRKKEVLFVYQDKPSEKIVMSDTDLKLGKEIEEEIIAKLVILHQSN